MTAIFNMFAVDAKPRTDRNRVVARFDAVVGCIRFAACAVIEQPDRSLIAELPGRAQSMRIIDPAIERTFQGDALAAYHAITEGVPHVV